MINYCEICGLNPVEYFELGYECCESCYITLLEEMEFYEND